jgi:hypothetical protein
MRTVYLLMFLVFFSCNNQNSINEQSPNEPNSVNENILDNQIEQHQDEIQSIDIGNEFCPEIKELNYFQKNGTITKTGQNNVVGEIKNESIYMKILLENCVIKYRAIESKLNCSKSFAKFHNGDLVFYDSTDNDCNIIIHFDVGIEDYNNIEILPEYLRNKVSLKK